jgi:hypothetical protein
LTSKETAVSAAVSPWGASIWSSATLPWRLAEVGAAGALAGILMVLAWFGLRPDLGMAVQHASFWIKAIYPVCVAVCGLIGATALARGRTGGGAAVAAAAAPACAMLLAAAIQALAARRLGLLVQPWSEGATCLGDILVIAAPMLTLVLVGLRDVDLERPALTGLACGLFCGGIAGAVDILHCGRTTFAFVGPWFTLALLITGALGAGAVSLLARRRPLAPE